MDTRYWYCVKPVIKEIIYQLKENNVKKMAMQMRPAKKVLFMNIEKKAKAYDEAVEKVKPLYKQAKEGNYPILLTYEYLFPELAESEDERIRRDIIHYILYKADGVSEEQEHSWIDYLERQKEQPMSAEEVFIRAGLKPYRDGNQWCVLAGGNIQEGICGFGDTIDEALYQFLMEVLKIQKEQKPAEWSEDDEYLLDETVQHLEELIRIDKEKHCGVNVQYYQRDIDWLKDRHPNKNMSYGELPLVSIDHMEGLDTDFEKQVGAVIASAMNREHQFTSEYVKWTAQQLMESAKDKLCIKPRWKPSKEHFQGLRRAITKAEKGSYAWNSLTDLYEQLKKL